MANCAAVLALLFAAVAPAGEPEERRYDDDIRAALASTKSVYAVPLELVRAVIRQESAFNPRALSKCGAIGLMQLMPFNAVKLGLANEKELWVPRLNILAGVRLLAALLRYYDGDVIAALVAYNSGPKSKLAPVPANGETPAYVRRILKLWRESVPAPRSTPSNPNANSNPHSPSSNPNPNPASNANANASATPSSLPNSIPQRSAPPPFIRGAHP